MAEGSGVGVVVAVEDTLSGVQEICDLASVGRVSVAGLRAGAIIAALAAARSRIVDKLVLWDPVSDGEAYVRHEIGSGVALGSSGDRQVHGFLFTRTFQTDLSHATLGKLDAFPMNVLLVVSEDLPEHRLLQEDLEERRVTVEFAHLDNPPAWTELGDLGVGSVPSNILKRIADW